MKKRFTFFVLIIIGVFLWTGSVYAGAFDFDDNTIYWSTWENTNNPNWNTREHSGAPDIKNNGAGTVYTDGDKLEAIKIYFGPDGYPNPTTNSGQIGDLFIDIGATGYWNYVVNGYMNDDLSGTYYREFDATVYKFDDGDFSMLKGGDGAYAHKTVTNTSWRYNHPYAYKSNTDIHSDIIGFNSSGVEIILNRNEKSLTFTGLNGGGTIKTVGHPNEGNPSSWEGIDLLNKSFTFAWTAYCANDVLKETHVNVIPEPATMFLFGSGLIGLAGLGRRR